MPIGEPTLSLEKYLNKIFGFVYGEITCPDESILQVPFIQFKDPLEKINSCPRGKFKRLIFSEEIKYALQYGYTINVEYCYMFERGKDLFKDFIIEHYEIKKTSVDPIKRATAKLFLNSLYGRMGMKELDNIMQIVNKTEAQNLDKNTNVTILSELSENKYLVKHSGTINDNIRKVYSKDPLVLERNKTKIYTKEELRKLGINKARNVPSAVHIASAICSYARIIINSYKNIPGNLCIMSDTDSAVLTKPLPHLLIGDGLGQMKLVHEIKKAIFIRKKLYCLITSDGQEIIKSSGLDSTKLNYESFNKLLNGENVEIERTIFKVGWKELNINIVESKLTVQGLIGSIKTIHNTPDVNFKYISFPIKYNIIVHPLFPLIIIYPLKKYSVSPKILLENITTRVVNPSAGPGYPGQSGLTTTEKFIPLFFILIMLILLLILLFKLATSK